MGRHRGPNRKGQLKIAVELVEACALAPNPLNPSPAERAQAPTAPPDTDGESRRHRLAREGRWSGAPPLGYKLSPVDRGVLQVDREQTGLVLGLFNRLIELGAVNRLAAHLKAEGITVPPSPSRPGPRGSGAFNPPGLKRLLTNPAYIGRIQIGDHTYPGLHVGIVPELIFRDVQAILASNKKRTANNRQGAHVYLLSGLLRCRCGSMMGTKRSTNQNGDNFYYHCEPSCGVRYVDAIDLELAVLRHLEGLLELHENSQRASLRDAIARHIEVIEWLPSPSDLLQEEHRLQGPPGVGKTFARSGSPICSWASGTQIRSPSCSSTNPIPTRTSCGAIALWRGADSRCAMARSCRYATPRVRIPRPRTC